MPEPNCVVIGGSGFLGRRLCQRLAQAGARVRSVSRTGRPRGEAQPWWRAIDWIGADMGTEACFRALAGADVLFHLASSTYPSTSNFDPVFDLESNLVGSVRLLNAAVEYGIRRVVFVSSGGTVYGIPDQTPIPEAHPTNPICSYGIHKLAVEKFLSMHRRLSGLGSIVLRVANMYGEDQSLDRPLGAVSHFVHRALSGIPIEVWGDGTVKRDFVYVDDVVDALIGARDYHGPEHVFNIGSGRSVTLNALIDLIEQRTGRDIRVSYFPARNFDIPDNLLDISRASQELRWTPATCFEDGLCRLITSAKASLTPEEILLSGHDVGGRPHAA